MKKVMFLKLVFSTILLTPQSQGADLLEIVRNPNLANHEVFVGRGEDRPPKMMTSEIPKVRIDRLWWCFVANNLHQELSLPTLTKLYASNAMLPPYVKGLAVQTLPNASDKEIRLALEHIYFDRKNKLLKPCPLKNFHLSGRI